MFKKNIPRDPPCTSLHLNIPFPSRVFFFFFFENQQNKTSSLISLSHANLCKALFFNFACFEHSNLFKVNGSEFYREKQKKEKKSFFFLDKTILKVKDVLFDLKRKRLLLSLAKKTRNVPRWNDSTLSKERERMSDRNTFKKENSVVLKKFFKKRTNP